MGVVVTGIGLVSALGIGVETNLTSIEKGISGISLSPTILRTSHRLPVGELRFTNEELRKLSGVSAHEHLSRTALLGILSVKEAIADARIDYSKRVGIVSATSVGGMDLTEQFFRQFIENDSFGRLRNVRMHDCAASTEAICRHCGINSYSTTISTACSSAANSIIMGAKLLKHNILDYVIVGGSDPLCAFTLNGFNSLKILDEKPCRPFDANRAGLNLGEGAGYLVLQRKEEAQSYYCHLAGYSNRNDAYHQTASSAEGNGAYLAMKEALDMAGILPCEVNYINAHGTGTQNNDEAESSAFIRLFGDNVPPFSSTKGFTGHTLAAAGGIEAVLSVLAIQKQCLYPNLNFITPITELGLIPIRRFQKNMEINCVMSNSFGFSGNCSSLIFQR